MVQIFSDKLTAVWKIWRSYEVMVWQQVISFCECFDCTITLQATDFTKPCFMPAGDRWERNIFFPVEYLISWIKEAFISKKKKKTLNTQVSGGGWCTYKHLSGWAQISPNKPLQSFDLCQTPTPLRRTLTFDDRALTWTRGAGGVWFKPTAIYRKYFEVLYKSEQAGWVVYQALLKSLSLYCSHQATVQSL